MQNSDAGPRFLMKREEAAQYLGLKSSTLAAWACNGLVRLPFVKLGRSVFYRRSDLDTFIDANVIGGVC